MAKKVLLIAFGAVLALVGAALAVVGVVLLIVTRGDSSFSTEATVVRTDTRALVADMATIDRGDGIGGLDPTLLVDAATLGSVDLFVGVGPAAEVERFLAGVEREDVRDVQFSPFSYTTVLRTGEREPAAPAEQPFWTAQVSGTGDRTLEARLDGSAQRLVVMNADGRAGLLVRASFGLRVPLLRRLGIGLTAGGGLAILTGLALLAWGVRTRVPPRPGPGGHATPPPAPSPWSPAPYAQPPPAAGPPAAGLATRPGPTPPGAG
ncbi:MAG TPA: hypothetical protein VE547_14160, partial [Mycobacteriales bacterium]|nr:hypothetical protein [Mycobacteriales bacterium]